LHLLLQIKKPLIERRRRERINECLGQLKALVLEATNKDVSYSLILGRTIYMEVYAKGALALFVLVSGYVC